MSHLRGLTLMSGDEGKYECNSSSFCSVLPFNKVGLKLAGERLTGKDGARVKLDEASLLALKALEDGKFDGGDEKYDGKDGKTSAGKDGKAPDAKNKSKPRYIVPIVDNFRRTKKGYQLMRQEGRKLVHLQQKWFPAKSMLDLDQKKIGFKYNGSEGAIVFEEFIAKLPHFMDNFYVQIRRKLDFGSKVHSWLVEIENEMSKNYRYKKLQELVWLVSSCKLTATKGFPQPEAAHEAADDEDDPADAQDAEDEAEDGSVNAGSESDSD